MAALTGALPAAPHGPDEALVEHALRLLATADVAEAEPAARARERLAVWSERSAAHQAAHAEALRRWQALAGAAAGLREQWADPLSERPTAHRPSAATRRTLLGMALAGVGVAGLAGAGAWWQWQAQQPVFAQAWRTRTAQLLRVTLPDVRPGTGASTEIVLSAQTALRAVLYRDRREIELAEGEARFDVAADAARPFVVHARSGRVEVVGTAFTVADRGGVLTVAVERGRVRLHPQPAAAGQSGATAGRVSVPGVEPIELGAGDSINVRDGQPPGPVIRVAAADVGAWRSGWLVFDDVPLAEALPAINAFRRAPLVLTDERTGRLRLTARFQAMDERGLLAALPRVLPVRIEQGAAGGAVVRMR